MLDGDTACGRDTSRTRRLTRLGTRFGDCNNVEVVRVAENEAGEGLSEINYISGI